MAWELEGLIAHLLMLISCAGEHGCSVHELLGAIRDSLAPSGSSSQCAQDVPPDRAASEVWKWLVRRSDVSVGHGREHNHLPLPELLSLPQLSPQASSDVQAPGATQARKYVKDGSFTSLGDAIRVRTSEATMWEAITGHAVDHKRVPRSEWLLLLGIASSKSDGILQGDLGRLVDQDKRSVPKRTDALFRKGYIVKRTTLIRGTKTSKMWLRSLVPPLPRESDPAEKPKVDMNLSRQTLAENLDPVPWRICWTGPDIDYKALATTIMALAKEWDVIRVRDLKEKLGVLGMRWQMKIVSKTCRFLNSRGAIQYVAAKLENRVFKDCVKFTRDMTADDWSIYLSTGKHPGKPARGSECIASDEDDGNERLSTQRANNARLSMCPPWSLDKPLPQAIAKTVQSFGSHGLSNPDIYMLTLGATFNRFLSSMTGSLSTTGIQPPHLGHLQMRSEHIRTGKVASYLFYLPSVPMSEAAASDLVEKAASPENGDPSASLDDEYGFLPATAVPTHASTSLAAMCGLGQPRKEGIRGMRRRGRQSRQTKRQQLRGSPPAEAYLGAMESAGMGTSQPDIPEEQRRSRQCSSRLVTLKLRPESVRLAMMEGRPTSPPNPECYAMRRTEPSLEAPRQRAAAGPGGSDEREPDSTPDNVTPPTSSTRGRGRKRGSGRPRGRPCGSGHGHARRSSQAQTSERTVLRPWRCEKCGGSWKNDLGLKYHLEKSRTSCNPSYTPPAVPTTRKSKQASFFRPKASSPSDETDSGSGTPCPDRNAFIFEDRSTSPLQRRQRDVRSQRDVNRAVEQRGYAPDFPILGTEKAMSTYPQSSSVNIGEARSRLSPLHANPGVLLRDEPMVSHQEPAFDSHPSHPDSPAFRPPAEANATELALPAQETDSAEAGTASGILLAEDRSLVVSAQQEPPEICHSSPGIPKTLNDASCTANAKQKKTARDRICNLIGDILSEKNGVILGGKSLWRAVTAAWHRDASDLPPPTSRACQSAVNTMIRTKLVTEHWHAFRDRKGLFAKCQLILRPGIDAFSPESMHLVDIAKDVQYPLDEPSQMGDSDFTESQSKTIRARGRRLLAKEVAILDAPVYAAQVAAKRAAEAASGSPHRPKRTKYSARRERGDGYDLAMFPESQAPNGIRFAVGGPGRRQAAKWLGDPSDPLAIIQPASSIRFLDPNTYLRDDSPPYEHKEPSVPIDPRLAQVEEQKPGLQEQPPAPVCYVFDDINPIVGSCGSWPDLDSHDFDRLGTSFTLSGWIPDRKWLRWAAFGHEVEKRSAAREARLLSATSTSDSFKRFATWIRACVEVEASWKTEFANAVPGEAGPHNIFVSVLGEDSQDACSLPLDLVWPPEGQLTLTSAHGGVVTLGGEHEPSSSDEESSPDPYVERKALRTGRKGVKFATVVGVRQQKIKRVALVSRALTALPARREETGDAADATEDSAVLMAAFIAVRSLLGGAEKAIDWGLLARLFPNLGVTYLRKFWADARKEQAAYISNFTRVFQERLITALDEEELPMIDFEKPLDYDWDNLIQWTVQLPRQEGFQIPRSRDALTRQYSLRDIKATGEDWREKYFHVVSSFFARYEAVSSEPGTVTVGEASRGFHESPCIDELMMARSWIKSLCSTAETGYSAEQIKSRFLQLAARSTQRRSELLKEAAAQLAQQRVICRKERPLVRGRPYRLNEWYLSTLAKMAQSPKYDEALAFKEELDSAFRRDETMKVPYTLNDGAMMALTNLNAAGRIRLEPVDIPNIPFGFEPGSYESRKTPKSCYHFALEAVPTPTYEYNEDIQVLRDVVRHGPPRGGPQGESPQWIDIFGQSNVQRWSELLGAFCFAFATRGSMNIEGICSALHPLLDEFEAHLIVAWGKCTGVLTDLMDNVGTTVGDWWWLAVPWTRRQMEGQTEKAG